MSANEIWGWSSYFSELARFLQSTANNYGFANSQYTEYCINRLAMCFRNLTSVKEAIEMAANPDTYNIISELNELLECVSLMYAQWSSYETSIIDAQHSQSGYRVPTRTADGTRGRPRFEISKEQLIYLKSLSFTWSEIASLLNVSRMTIYRRRREYDMLEEAPRSMTANELTQFVEELRTQLPDIGETLVIGRLQSLGYHVPRERVRQSIRSTDPLNTALRWHGVTARRPYSVPGPNSLWHIGS